MRQRPRPKLLRSWSPRWKRLSHSHHRDVGAERAKEPEEIAAKTITGKDKLITVAEIIKRARTEEEMVGSVSMQEAMAQVVVETEAIINAAMEATEFGLTIALAFNN